MARGPKTAKAPKALKPPDPDKVVRAPPRMKPVSTREYGKGGTPLSGNPNSDVVGQSFGGFGGEDGTS